MLHPLIVVPDVTWQRKAMMIAAPHKAGAPEAKGLPSINQPIMHPNLSETKQACRKDTNYGQEPKYLLLVLNRLFPDQIAKGLNLAGKLVPMR
jgi:hypothetical protein